MPIDICDLWLSNSLSNSGRNLQLSKVAINDIPIVKHPKTGKCSKTGIHPKTGKRCTNIRKMAMVTIPAQNLVEWRNNCQTIVEIVNISNWIWVNHDELKVTIYGNQVQSCLLFFSSERGYFSFLTLSLPKQSKHNISVLSVRVHTHTMWLTIYIYLHADIRSPPLNIQILFS